MTNRMHDVLLQDVRLDPIESEIRISVYADQVTPTTEVRGRLIGPRCAWSRTLEVAYPLRPYPSDRTNEQTSALNYRVVIPEASFWDPQTPFLYEGPIELWQDGAIVDQGLLGHGLRTRSVGPSGVRWNGEPITLSIVPRTETSQEDAIRLRQAGCNTLLAPVRAADVWRDADRLGLLVLGRIRSSSDLKIASLLQRHACSLGWVNEPIAKPEEITPDAIFLLSPAAQP
jgi:hypothetical protein